ncbi:MAG: hypothetical protein FWG20_01415, partial [Candidatus Cloacimonetes bacterium]|nr:hypothetical protein [Candidatus Cloacimonadota bacterium]
TKKTWNYTAFADLTLSKFPLNEQPYISEINKLTAGGTLTIQKNKLTISKSELNFLGNKDHDVDHYWFLLKKAFELHFSENEFVVLPFENTHSGRFAFSVWSNKPKKEWGLLDGRQKDFSVEKYLHSNISSGLKIYSLPEFQKSSDVFKYYTEYVLQTGLTDFPSFFSQAGHFKAEKGIKEINLLTHQAEWFFEKEPLKITEKLFNILKNKSIADFKKFCITDNVFFRKDFYKYLQKDIEKGFLAAAENIMVLNNIYDEYYFFIQQHQIKMNAKGIAWLNEFRHFYSPGLLFSLCSKHLSQRLFNKEMFPNQTPKKKPLSFLEMNAELYKNFSDDCQTFPKIKENKYTVLNYPNQNQRYFPLIANQIGSMVENAEKIPYYDFPLLVKLFNKAKKGNAEAIAMMLRWTAFEIWRKKIDEK